MVKYNQVLEFNKISDGFRRVKIDIGKIYNLIAQNTKKQDETDRLLISLQKQVKLLNAKLEFYENFKINDNKHLIGNLESKKFHYNNCPYAKNIREDHITHFDNIEDAVKHGFDECACIREF